jgi:hypothetical protein
VQRQVRGVEIPRSFFASGTVRRAPPEEPKRRTKKA